MAEPAIDYELLEGSCLGLGIIFRYPPGSEWSDEPVVVFDQYGIEIYYFEECRFPWSVSKLTVIPGIRYRRDGTGEPDEIESKQLSSHQTFQDALSEALGFCAKEAVSQEIESLAWESIYSDDENYKEYQASRTIVSAPRMRLEALGCEFKSKAGMIRGKVIDERVPESSERTD